MTQETQTQTTSSARKSSTKSSRATQKKTTAKKQTLREAGNALEQVALQELDVLSSEAELPDDEEDELSFGLVTLRTECLKFIPGPVANRVAVLKQWCRKNCKSPWKMMKNTRNWVFEDKLEAAMFEKAWNVRDGKTDSKKPAGHDDD